MEVVLEVISHHLLSHRRLVVPTFGAFMVKESGERLFSDLLCTDDGVLASLLQGKGLSDMESAILIDRFIFKVRHELEQYGYCRLGDIGTLRVEPATKSLRLYPPVQGEMPKHIPYVPKQVSETEYERQKTENEKGEFEYESKNIGGKKEAPIAPIAPIDPNASNASNAPKTPTPPKKAIKSRRKFDFVMVAAIVIVVLALVAIGYGWYVSNLSVSDDDAAMDALRVIPGQMINE